MRGIADSGWSGLSYCETGWADNRLEYVELHNAHGPNACPVGGSAVLASVVVGRGVSTAVQTQLTVENVAVSGPNNGTFDLYYTNSVLVAVTLAGTNHGSDPSGGLLIGPAR